jgi:hypothetical protein
LAGFPIFYFWLQDIYKSYRQILNEILNFQLLLKREILDKLRLVTSYKMQYKENTTFDWLNPDRRNGNSLDLEPQSVDIATLAA